MISSGHDAGLVDKILQTVIGANPVTPMKSYLTQKQGREEGS